MDPKKSKLQFQDFTVIKSYIELNTDLVDKKGLSINIIPKGKFIARKEGGSEFILTIDLRINEEKKDFVEINVISQGLFICDFDSGEEESKMKSYLITNAPAIVFPYIRAYISTLTTVSGISAIVLPTLNLSKGIKEILEKNIEYVKL